MKEITDEILDKYFDVTKRALDMVEDKFDKKRLNEAEDFFNMAKSYYDDAHFFRKKGDYVRAFGAVYYAHGWLDAGARIRLFLVNDSTLFTVDDQ
jgi:uncharacterized protein